MNTLRKSLSPRAVRTGLVLAGLLLGSSSANAAIQYNIESPATGFPASGIGNIAGWAFTNTPGAKIQRLITVKIDNEPAFRVPCCSSRGDVAAVHPSAPMETGFSGVYNFQRLSAGMHTVKLTIKSTANETKIVTRTFEVVKVSPYPFLDSFKWQSGSDCESLNGLDPVNANAGAVCTKSRATSKGPGNPTSDCDGTLQFAFNRANQTFHPVAGCDPQGTLSGGGGGGVFIDPGKLPPGFGQIGDKGVDWGSIPPGLLGCLVGSPSNVSVNVTGLVPTFTFNTAVAAKVSVEIYEQGQVGQNLAGFGSSEKGTYHSIKPHPFLTAIKPDTTYEYQIRVKSNCNKPDLVVNGPSTFKTKKRVARMFIDKAYVIDDGDDWPAGSGEISFSLKLGGNLKTTGEFSADDGDTLYPAAGVSWTAATDHFVAEFWGSEYDGNFESAEVKTLSFGPSLTYSGGTWEGTRIVTDDNMRVKLWLRVEVSYE